MNCKKPRRSQMVSDSIRYIPRWSPVVFSSGHCRRLWSPGFIKRNFIRSLSENPAITLWQTSGFKWPTISTRSTACIHRLLPIYSDFGYRQIIMIQLQEKFNNVRHFVSQFVRYFASQLARQFARQFAGRFGGQFVHQLTSSPVCSPVLDS